MMISAKPPLPLAISCEWRRRAFARRSRPPRSEDSSIHSGLASRSLQTSSTRFQSRSPTLPLRSLSLGIRARLAIRRWASSDSDISSEKNATGRFSFTATCSAMLATKPDLPMPGRAARMIRLPG